MNRYKLAVLYTHSYCSLRKKPVFIMLMLLWLQLLSVERMEQSLEGTVQSELCLHPAGQICNLFLTAAIFGDSCAYASLKS